MKLIQGDCLEVMRKFKNCCIDTIITDPPYALEFMGKGWDKVLPAVKVWKEALRVAKPGAFLLAFGGTRTYHRLTCAIEDAGWEIRDCIMWLYGSGFPKSTNISKNIDKMAGKSLKWFIDYVLEVAEERGVTKKQLTALFPSKTGGMTGWLYNKASGTQSLTIEQYNTLKDFLNLPFETLEEAEREIIGKGTSGRTAIWNEQGSMGNFDLTAPATSEAQLWNGWGTALKPAWEPIVVAMKPIDGTFANNALKWGVGGLNINGGRIGTKPAYVDRPRGPHSPLISQLNGQGTKSTGGQGRFPANLILDEESAKMLDEQTGQLKSGDLRGQPRGKNKNVYGAAGSTIGNPRFYKGDSGGASRFFYCARASKSERGEDNNHPTVKPLKLIEYLCDLTMPPMGGVLLDPFGGSGTTGIACKNLNRKCILIDKEQESCEIAVNRLSSPSQEAMPLG